MIPETTPVRKVVDDDDDDDYSTDGKAGTEIMWLSQGHTRNWGQSQD